MPYKGSCDNRGLQPLGYVIQNALGGLFLHSSHANLAWFPAARYATLVLLQTERTKQVTMNPTFVAEALQQCKKSYQEALQEDENQSEAESRVDLALSEFGVALDSPLREEIFNSVKAWALAVRFFNAQRKASEDLLGCDQHEIDFWIFVVKRLTPEDVKEWEEMNEEKFNVMSMMDHADDPTWLRYMDEYEVSTELFYHDEN